MADLPRGWERLVDNQGRTYYHDTNTGTTHWTPPPPPPPPPDSSATAPPLSHADSYNAPTYQQSTGNYRPPLNSQQSAGYPTSTPPTSSPPSRPDFQGPPQQPYQSSYIPHSHGYPSHASSYSTPQYPSHNQSYATQPSHVPNGAPQQRPDRYGHGHPPPYGSYPPTSQTGYGSPQSGYGQSSHDPHPPPPMAYPPDPHAPPSHGGYGLPPPAYAPPPTHGLPPPPTDYGRPSASGQSGYAHAFPPHPPQNAPQGYPSAPGQPSQPPRPPHQPSYQPPPGGHPSQVSHVPTNMSAVTAGISQLSMGGPNSKVVPISLEFRANGLRDRDFIGKSDPILHVYQPKQPALDETKVTQWRQLGSTEVIENNVNPTWVQRVEARFFFERHQPLRFEIVDVDNKKTKKGDHLGFAHATLAEIVRNGMVRLKITNKTGGKGRGELTVRAHDLNPAGKVRLQLTFAGKNLDKKDFMGKSDPYYKLMRVLPGTGGTSMLYKSEEKMNDTNPTWKPHTVMLHGGGLSWPQIQMAVEVYDWDRYTPHDLIGETTFSLTDLTKTKSFPLINKKKQAKKGSRYKNSGELLVHRADAVELPSFISYLQGGLRLDFIVAVDFTASNRPVDNPQSLHYMEDMNHPSQYYQALHAVGTILSDYLVDGYITALGFGAKLPGHGDQAAFDFALSGQPDARVYGVQGLLDAYKIALSNVTLAGPTYFTPIIRNAMGVANSCPVSQTNQHFAVLLILTDGIITDLSATIDAIIDASQSTPIAIVVVGIGKADFRAMERLDGDNFKLRSDQGDKVAKHDIVQFTKYDPTKPTEYLASDVLQEVPQRVVEFLADAGIKPNPPVGQPPIY